MEEEVCFATVTTLERSEHSEHSAMQPTPHDLLDDTRGPSTVDLLVEYFGCEGLALECVVFLADCQAPAGLQLLWAVAALLVSAGVLQI